MPLNSILKSFSSLFDNLENNNVKNDKNLNQGKELLNYEIMYKNQVLPHLKPLQITTSTNLSSIIETLVNNSSVNNSSNDTMSDIEKRFNQTLTEYSNTHKAFIENLMNNTKYHDEVSKYYGKVVKNGDVYTYVNDYGFTHKYLSNSWAYNDSSCPSTFETVNNSIMNKFLLGPNMGSGQACKIAGQNVENNETNEVAWVDIKGFKHVYPKEVWENKKNSCNINPIQLSSVAYNNIPSDTPMEKNTECVKLNADPILWEKLQKLNDELISLSYQLVNETNQLKTDDANLNIQLNDRKNKLDEYIKYFKANRYNIQSVKQNYNTIIGQEKDSHNYTKPAQYQYIIWLILAILLVLAILRTVNGDVTVQIGGIVILVSLFYALLFC